MSLKCNKAGTCEFAHEPFKCNHSKEHDEFCNCSQTLLCLQTGEVSACVPVKLASKSYVSKCGNKAD